MISRDITGKLHYFTEKYPVVTLTGPRQSGKSTLLKNSFPNYHYISLEDPDTLLIVEEDPRLFLRNYPDKTIIDEAQRFPGLFSYLQTHVDVANKEGMYILSGSHNFLLMEKISQTLAGRTAILKLLPFSYNELVNHKIDPQSLDKLIYTGSYPRIYDKNLHPEEFYPYYIQTYIERDIRQLKNVSDISLFIRFVKLCAGRIGQLLNISGLANECGISQPTAKAWLSLLETSYVIYMLKPHYRNFNKRLVKNPKLYFYDTGLACSLLGLHNEDQLNTHYLKGYLFENWVIMEYQKQCYNNATEPELFFWRDNIGNEIDLLIEKNNELKAVEIKSGLTPGPDFFKGLLYWQKLSSCSNEQLSVVYGGEMSGITKNGLLLSWKDWALNHPQP
jgi:hypothetical protein